MWIVKVRIGVTTTDVKQSPREGIVDRRDFHDENEMYRIYLELLVRIVNLHHNLEHLYRLNTWNLNIVLRFSTLDTCVNFHFPTITIKTFNYQTIESVNSGRGYGQQEENNLCVAFVDNPLFTITRPESVSPSTNGRNLRNIFETCYSAECTF